jgi:flagellar hook-associated protein 2
LTLNRAALTEALTTDATAVQSLFADSATGAFTLVGDVIDDYTQAGGFLPDARTNLTDEIARLGRRIDDLQARLAIRRAALQQEFIAADQAMTRLNNQKSSLESIGAGLISNSF